MKITTSLLLLYLNVQSYLTKQQQLQKLFLLVDINEYLSSFKLKLPSLTSLRFSSPYFVVSSVLLISRLKFSTPVPLFKFANVLVVFTFAIQFLIQYYGRHLQSSELLKSLAHHAKCWTPYLEALRSQFKFRHFFSIYSIYFFSRVYTISFAVSSTFIQYTHLSISFTLTCLVFRSHFIWHAHTFISFCMSLVKVKQCLWRLEAIPNL